MSDHTASSEDLRYRDAFEAGRVEPDGFGHREHILLAYVYLIEGDPDTATERMRDAILGLLDRHGLDTSKFHETLTRAWILAVRHFMDITPRTGSADALIDANPSMLDSRIMLTHYSAERLFSDEARLGFVEPDLDEIPTAGWFETRGEGA